MSDSAPMQMTDTARMIHRANQIAAFFSPYAEERARADLADHLNSFWTPAMRRQLLDFIDSGETQALHPLCHAARPLIRG